MSTRAKPNPLYAQIDSLLTDQYESRCLAALFGSVKRQLRTLKYQYKTAVYAAEQSEAQRILYDNYYMLEKEGKLLLKEDKQIMVSCNKRTGAPLLGDALVIAAQEGELEVDCICDVIARIQQARYITSMELDSMLWTFRFCIVNRFCEIQRQEHGDGAELMALIGLLSRSDMIDLSLINRRVNPIELLYSAESTGMYQKLDETTRWLYRTKTSKLAIKQGVSEQELAKTICKLAQEGATERERHIGHVIYERYAKRFPTISSSAYMWLQMLVPLALAIVLMLLQGCWWMGLLLYLPLWAVAKPVLDYICTRRMRHEYLPRLELHGRIPDEAKTMLVVSTLLSGGKELLALKSKLKRLYYANPAENLHFCILCDMRQAAMPVLPEDKALIRGAQKLIRRLNAELGDRFMIIVRPRSYSKTQNEYTGFERKRGAIEQLVAIIKGETVPLAAMEGNEQFLSQVKFIAALDYDTKALMDTVSQLVAVALHPLNKPEVENGVVMRGYGIFTPKMVTGLRSSLKSPFSKIMGGVGGTSAYDDFCVDIYQDAFGEGIFSGKGLLDVDVFHEVLHGVFPDERVLSHDILEGSFMRTAFVGDIAFSDGFPASSIAYFKRLHRWIRGDIQNIPYLSRTIETKRGRIKNPLGSLSRFKLFDNVRRAVTPVAILICFAAGAFAPHPLSVTLALTALLAVVFPYLFGFFPALISGGLFSLSRRFYSGVLTQSALLLFQSVYALVLLPKLALVSLDATARALWRRFISHKHLLEWTTAAQVERNRSNGSAQLAYYGLAELVGIAFILIPTPFTRLIGIAFAMLLPLIIYSDKPYPSSGAAPHIRNRERDRLLSYAAAMWQFYEDYAGPAENYLPPDNVQNAPVFTIAHRTSPTNIGLLLLSMLCARDFDLIDSEGLYKRCDRTLRTIESLPKWHGNLYNWYDTQTLGILCPQYVSSVDSGNFTCCLIALKEGLAEYISENTDLCKLIQRLNALIATTNIGAFYNKSKRLLAIGYDVSAGCLSDHHYDLMMSEARMTSYLAIARRQVPKKHWQALGRTMARLGSYAGPVSWTGTMFEYFMPELLLNCEEGSMGYEGLRFCLHCQKRRARELRVPFGISESGYYAFDSQLNYQYKAHGVQKIGLKRGLDTELVIAPYASYLTLSHDFSASYANLERLRQMGATGTYGHYEAIDFTPARVGMRNAHAIIKSYMAHHVGMSLVAIANCLNSNAMQRRFLNDSYMESASELLEERVPVGSVLFEDIQKKEPVKKNLRESPQTECYSTFFPQQPRVNLLCNGEFTSVLTDLGIGHISYQGRDVILRTTDLLRRPQGAFFGIVDGGKPISFTYMPMYDDQSERTVEFSPNAVDYYCNTRGLKLGMKVFLHQSLPCELRRIGVKNSTGRRRQIHLAAYFEPVLAKFQDHEAHPAFMRLFLKQEYDPKSKLFIISRKERHANSFLYMAVGFVDEVDFTYAMQREDVLTRPLGMLSVFDKSGDRINYIEQVPDPCVFIKVELPLESHQQVEHTLFTCVALTKEELLLHVAKIRQERYDHAPTLQSPIVYDTIEGRLAGAILPMLLYKKRDCIQNLSAIGQNTLPPNALWGLGISGDLPIVLVEVISPTDEERITSYIKCHRALKLCGIAFDLVFAFKDKGAYDRPIYTFVSGFVKEQRSEDALSQRGGIHLADLSKVSEDVFTLLQAIAVHTAPKNMMRVNLPAIPFSPIAIQSSKRPDSTVKGIPVAGGVFVADSFTITAQPPHPWCTVLANPAFGTLLSESALGFTWAVNSRENKLTPWYNDLTTDNRGELLLVRAGDRCVDLVWGSMATFSPERAVYQGESEQFASTVTVMVAEKGCLKQMEVLLENKGNAPLTVDCAYYTEPVLGVSRETARQISGSFEEDILYLHNPFNAAVTGYMALSSSERIAAYTLDRAAFLSGRWEECLLAPSGEPCGTIIVRKQLPPRGSVRLRFTLSFGKTKQAAAKQAQLAAFTHARKGENRIAIQTPDKLLDAMFNTWLPWQVLGGRIYGKTGFYQNGGAWGFRDQLQDACAALLTSPAVTKRQILRSCNAQFAEGDVLHWWHMLPNKLKKGVRTRCSDDLLWLPYTVCEYLDKTNDSSILDTNVSYTSAPTLTDDEHERYLEVTDSTLRESVYAHCKRAIAHSMELMGEHGLPLMGSGDWNDGYNAVGMAGKGESVWLALFFSIVLRRFAPVAAAKGEQTLAAGYLTEAQRLLDQVEEHCWDGEWYLRAFYDNGKPLGSHENSECRLDSLVQSFAVLAGLSNTQRNALALNAAVTRLVDTVNGIIKLFDPPFGESDTSDAPSGEPRPGYVASYPKGIRENGGQYTHAAVWLCTALYESGDAQGGYRLLQMLNPAVRCQNEQQAAKYKNEPYYLSADIYTNHECYGRGGWAIYTGAAGWYYRVILEQLLGVKIERERIMVNPHIPESWNDCIVSLDYRNTTVHISLRRGKDGDSRCMLVDGKEAECIPIDAGVHKVEIIL